MLIIERIITPSNQSSWQYHDKDQEGKSILLTVDEKTAENEIKIHGLTFRNSEQDEAGNTHFFYC